METNSNMEEEEEGEFDDNILGRSVEQSTYENRMINEYSERIEKEEERKRNESETRLLSIRNEIEKVENVIKRTKDPHVISFQKKRLKNLRLQERGIEKVLSRKKRVPQESVDLVQPEKEKSRMISMGVLTPFEALAKGKDVHRVHKQRIQRTDLLPKSQTFKSSLRSRSSNAINRQNLRNRKNKVDPDLEYKRLRNYKKRKRVETENKKKSVEAFRDDGDEGLYNKRIKAHYAEKEVPCLNNFSNFDFNSFFEAKDDVHIEGGFRYPGSLRKRLFDYQHTCVKWMWQLHQQSVGGILGDEMGLGKTIEVISFLAGLHYSNLFAPSLIVVPATVLSQWVEEFHRWWPYFRVTLLHSSGTYHGYTKDTIKSVKNSNNGIIVTTYDHLRIYSSLYLRYEWGYLILDEGHKIRNPNAEITLLVKKINTPHRILMTGTPIQNSLKELWSQFDFVFPGLLGTLPVFQTQFGIPISQGQYANASEFQVYTAYQCAKHLRDLIQPYLLRRMKKDVGKQLPPKKERILFCRLSPLQLRLYRQYLRTKEVTDVSENRGWKRKSNTGMVFKVLSILRQICNHPDILIYDESKKATLKRMNHRRKLNARILGKINGVEEEEEEEDEDMEDFGAVYKSGKLKVVDEILRLWYRNGHKVLLYSQSIKMLDILEHYLKKNKRYESRYLRMDGQTSISKRLELINSFNTGKNSEGDDYFVFLLTTKVGGIGVNLTGADRILLFDPDWNPQQDLQAQARSWRIGQTKEVHCYRLMTAGTIEEKIYHRQIFKQFLTNKILQDPKQKRFFKENRLKDLFQLGKEYDGIMFDADGKQIDLTQNSDGRKKRGNTETSKIFKRSEIGYGTLKRMIYEEHKKRKERREKRKKEKQNQRLEEEEEEDLNDDYDEEEEKEKKKKKRKRRRPEIPKPRETGMDPQNPQPEQQRKKKKKRKKKMKSVLKVERFKYGDSSSSSRDSKSGSKSKETSILKRLFDSKSIHNIIDHEKVSEGSRSRQLIEKESQKIADEAIRKLKNSTRMIRERTDFRVNEPTWTGDKGVDVHDVVEEKKKRKKKKKKPPVRILFGRKRIQGGASRKTVKPPPRMIPIEQRKKKKKKNSARNIVPVPPPPAPPPSNPSGNSNSTIFGGIKKKGGMSSSQVISRIRSGQGSDDKKLETSVRITKLICTFFRDRGYHSVGTQEIVKHFSGIKGDDRFTFRILLQKAATCSDGKWTLKKEFHSV